MQFYSRGRSERLCEAGGAGLDFPGTFPLQVDWGFFLSLPA